MISSRLTSAVLALAAALQFAQPTWAADDERLAGSANAALATVVEAAGAETVARSRAILIAPEIEEAPPDRALLRVQLSGGEWSNPLLLTVESGSANGQTDGLDGENLVLLAMTETGVAALTDDDPALGDQFDLAVINLSGGLASVPRLSGFDLIVFTDGPRGGAAVRQGTVLFVIDAMRNASLYGDYFVVSDILSMPNQFAVFGTMMETLQTAR